MVAGSEENKRRDFTINNVQGWELLTTEFKHRTWFLGILEVAWDGRNGCWNLEWAGNFLV